MELIYFRAGDAHDLCPFRDFGPQIGAELFRRVSHGLGALRREFLLHVRGVDDFYDGLIHAIYGGVQYFIYGDKLKLMAGAEWSRLNGDTGDSYDGFTFLTGVRVSF